MISIFGPARLQWLHFFLFFAIGWSGLIFFSDRIYNNIPLLLILLLITLK